MAGADAARWVPLRHYLGLKRGRTPELIVSFSQIEDVLGDALPKPARKYAAWWENNAANDQARAWLDAGWQVRAADLDTRQVIFEPVAVDDESIPG